MTSEVTSTPTGRSPTSTVSTVASAAESTPLEWDSRLYRFDRLMAYSLLFAFLLLSPFSVPPFEVSGHYVGEIPVIGSIFFAMFLGRIPLLVLRRIILVGLTVLLVLTPFLLRGLARGATFADAYGDARALLVLSVLTTLLFRVRERSSIRFIVLASVFSLVSYVAVTLAGLDVFLLNSADIETRKITYPLLLYVVACHTLSYRRRWSLLVCVLGFAFLVAQTAYRYAYVTLGLTLVACVAGPFLASKRPAWLKTALGVAVLAGTLAIVPKTRTDALRFFDGLQERAYSIGVHESIIQQTVTKNIEGLEGRAGPGDAIYLQYLSALVDVRRFAVPRGLGQHSSIGDPAIFYGNTIDNTIIFLDYHFGIWVTFALLIVTLGWYIRRTRGHSLLGHAELAALLAPILFALYFRAVPFTNLAGAVSFAFAIRAVSYRMDVIHRREGAGGGTTLQEPERVQRDPRDG